MRSRSRPSGSAAPAMRPGSMPYARTPVPGPAPAPSRLTAAKAAAKAAVSGNTAETYSLWPGTASSASHAAVSTPSAPQSPMNSPVRSGPCPRQ